MDASDPGNANLPIGASSLPARAKPANREIGAPREENAALKLWHSRGYLPHFESPQTTQHVTFHLADSLPQTVLRRLNAEVKTLPAEKKDAGLRQRIEQWMDAGHGSCVLRNPAIAEMVQGSLLAFDAVRYHQLAWVVMPNHVHALFEPINGWTVAEIVAAWKKFTARAISDSQRDAQRKSGSQPSAPIWHREYWDRYIRNQRHLNRAVDYIHQNPVRANLAATPESYPWSSAYSGNANLPIGGFSPPTKAKDANREIGAPRQKP